MLLVKSVLLWCLMLLLERMLLYMFRCNMDTCVFKNYFTDRSIGLFVFKQNRYGKIWHWIAKHLCNGNRCRIKLTERETGLKTKLQTYLFLSLY